MTDEENLANLITQHERRLQKLKEQQAVFGLSADPHILIEIEDIEAKLAPLREQEASQRLTGLPVDKIPQLVHRGVSKLTVPVTLRQSRSVSDGVFAPLTPHSGGRW